MIHLGIVLPHMGPHWPKMFPLTLKALKKAPRDLFCHVLHRNFIWQKLHIRGVAFMSIYGCCALRRICVPCQGLGDNLEKKKQKVSASRGLAGIPQSSETFELGFSAPSVKGGVPQGNSELALAAFPRAHLKTTANLKHFMYRIALIFLKSRFRPTGTTIRSRKPLSKQQP